jgi:hypothetical protein
LGIERLALGVGTRRGSGALGFEFSGAALWFSKVPPDSQRGRRLILRQGEESGWLVRARDECLNLGRAEFVPEKTMK